MNVMTKLNELNYKFRHYFSYSPDLYFSDYYLFSNLKMWIQRKIFASNDDVEWETAAYFGAY